MFDFPASPTDGQTANGYTWSAASQCWLGGPAGSSGGGTAISVGDTPPVGPVDNQQWWESDTGITWLYYNDGNTKQWVATTAAGGAYLPLEGGTLSGDVTISKVGPMVAVNTASGNPGGGFFIRQANVHRWAMGPFGNESSGNAGSDLGFFRFTDAGAYVDAPLSVNRATGVVTATGLPRAPTATAGIGQWQAINGASGAAIALPAGGTWAYAAWVVNATNGTSTGLVFAGVAAGGGIMIGANAGYFGVSFCWRIA